MASRNQEFTNLVLSGGCPHPDRPEPTSERKEAYHCRTCGRDFIVSATSAGPRWFRHYGESVDVPRSDGSSERIGALRALKSLECWARLNSEAAAGEIRRRINLMEPTQEELSHVAGS